MRRRGEERKAERARGEGGAERGEKEGETGAKDTKKEERKERKEQRKNTHRRTESIVRSFLLLPASPSLKNICPGGNTCSCMRCIIASCCSLSKRQTSLCMFGYACVP